MKRFSERVDESSDSESDIIPATPKPLEESSSSSSTLYIWAKNNNATYNGEKFEGMTLPRGLSNGGNYVDPSRAAIENKETVKDLGVYVSNSCLFSEHIKIYVRETQKIAAWLLRTFLSRDKWVLKGWAKPLFCVNPEKGWRIWNCIASRGEGKGSSSFACIGLC